MAKIKVENTEISVVNVQNEDYISLTDMAHSQMQEHIIFRWLSLKSTIEYLGEWEMLYNPNFNCIEFGTIKIRIIQLFPFSEILYCAFEAHPSENNMLLHLAMCHIGQRDIIFILNINNRYFCIFNFYLRHNLLLLVTANLVYLYCCVKRKVNVIFSNSDCFPCSFITN